MVPVTQTIVDDTKGDCLRASVCSLLELKIEDVPNFAEMDFFGGLDRWLKERGLKFIRFSTPASESLHASPINHKHFWMNAYPEDQPEYLLVWGDSPRMRADGRPRQHICVAKHAGYGIEIVHDPHESREGLASIYGYGWIVPVLDPAKVKVTKQPTTRGSVRNWVPIVLSVVVAGFAAHASRRAQAGSADSFGFGVIAVVYALFAIGGIWAQTCTEAKP